MKIITTVGTSILFNWSKGDTKRYKDCRGTFDLDTWEDIKSSDIYKLVPHWAIQTGQNASAEIASIIGIQAERKEPLDIVLLCTDTLESYLAAHCVKLFFESDVLGENKGNFSIAEPIRIENLLVSSKDVFEKGLLNLFGSISTISNGDWNKVGFNITGGYKAIIPHITILAQIFKLPIYYIFEENEQQNYELLKVPQIPVSFDWLEVEPVLDFLKDEFKQDATTVKLFDLLGKGYVIEKKDSYDLTKTVLGADAWRSKKIDFSDMTKLSLFNAIYKKLLNNGLINHDCNLTPIGKLIQQQKEKRPAGKDFLGHTMELFIESYFNQATRHESLQHYSVQEKYDITGSYSIDLSNGNISINKKEIKIGDIDVHLFNNTTNTPVICEVKAFSAMSDYTKEIETKDDYLFQLKARILKYLEDKKCNSIEILLLIYEFQLAGNEKCLKEKIQSYENTSTILNHLKKLETDDQLASVGKVKFNVCLLQKIQSLEQYGAKKSLYDMGIKNNLFSFYTP